jgi:hypothetical protein
MKRVFYKIFPIIIVLLVVSAACVAPPKPNTTTSSTSGGTSQSGTGQSTIENSTFQYVTIETPYQISTTQRIMVTTLPTTPLEEWVEIYRTTQVFSYNKTAISFDMKNPPMLIHFRVLPVNVTRNATIIQHWDAGVGQMTTENIKYEYFSPYSWFEVTVRNKDTGRILVQNGFGNAAGNQYSQETNRTIKVLNTGNLLIELAGNQVTATVDINVDKKDNII